MLEEVCALRQWGRSAERQHKTAAARRDPRPFHRNSQAGGIDLHDGWQISDREQFHEYCRSVAGKKNLEVGADRAGKRGTAKMIKRRCMVLPVI
jgi:hypothetical protein